MPNTKTETERLARHVAPVVVAYLVGREVIPAEMAAEVGAAAPVLIETLMLAAVSAAAFLWSRWEDRRRARE